MKPTPLPLVAAALALALSACSTADAPPAPPPITPPTQACSAAGVAASSASALQTVCVLTSAGEFVVELDATAAPLTVANFLAYVTTGYYTQTLVHRVERSPLQVFQGGALVVDADYFIGERTPGLPAIPLESDNGRTNLRGTIAMARGPAPDSAKAQFFVNVQDNPELDHVTTLDGAGNPIPNGYAVFGRVISGMATVDAIGAAAVTSLSAGYAEFPYPIVIVYWVKQLK